MDRGWRRKTLFSQKRKWNYLCEEKKITINSHYSVVLFSRAEFSVLIIRNSRLHLYGKKKTPVKLLHVTHHSPAGVAVSITLCRFSNTMKVTIIHNGIVIYQQVTFSVGIINEETAIRPEALTSKIWLLHFGNQYSTINALFILPHQTKWKEKINNNELPSF